MFDKILEDLPYDAVVLEDFQSAAIAVRYLVDTGCRPVSYTHLTLPTSDLV